jgi:hypothetical protein
MCWLPRCPASPAGWDARLLWRFLIPFSQICFIFKKYWEFLVKYYCMLRYTKTNKQAGGGERAGGGAQLPGQVADGQG